VEIPASQDSYVQVAADGAGKKIDNAELTREPETQGGTGETVYRQRVVISDDINPSLQARLDGEAGYGALQVDAKTLGHIHLELVQIREILQLLIGT
jgi:hypothetical protein